jgi:glucosamine--fructose-6-phosphate aminotransferase (isomerizing)
VLGIGAGEILVASDAAALVQRKRSVAYLGDGELALLPAHGCETLNLDGAPIATIPSTINGTLIRRRSVGSGVRSIIGIRS